MCIRDSPTSILGNATKRYSENASSNFDIIRPIKYLHKLKNLMLDLNRNLGTALNFVIKLSEPHRCSFYTIIVA